MIKNNNKGFTLIELLVVVLILGILAAMAMPQYFKAVERSRMSEAVSLMGNIAQAQQRKYLQINKYATKYTGLDVSPKGSTGSTYHTKGDPADGGGNGFAITLATGTGNDAYDKGNVVATREPQTGGTLQYKYVLSRYYANSGTSCRGTDENGQALCADFCGIDEYSKECCSDGTEATADGTAAAEGTAATMATFAAGAACTKPDAAGTGL